jgi:hypothetical protein
LRNGISGANYLDWARQSTSFKAMAAISGAGMSYSGGGEPRSLRAALVSAPYFDVFGARAVLGRTFAQGEDQPGTAKVTVITHRLWLNLFGADRGVVGREILLSGGPTR